MLFETTFADIMRCTLQKVEMLNKNRKSISNFEELCAVLKQDDSKFTAVVDADELEVNYHLYPVTHSDYLIILDAVTSMGAHKTSCSANHMCDIINLVPAAPTFWLHIPMFDKKPGLTLVQAAGLSEVQAEQA